MNAFRIDRETRIGRIELQVADLERVAQFYRDVLGFQEIRRDVTSVSLSADGNPPERIVLSELAGARPRPSSAPGLFHTAFLYPGRMELARALRRAADRGARFQGFADHGVSEALYLADPEGNGVELYRDRPRNEWPLRGNKIEMVTVGLDVQDLLGELREGGNSGVGIDPSTTIGHVHLQVSNLQKSGDFYAGVLGFDITQDTYPGALFVAAGGYHHHIGLNIWNSRGASPAPADVTGLRSFGISVPDPANVEALRQRLGEAEIEIHESGRSGSHFWFTDPDSIRVEVLS